MSAQYSSMLNPRSLALLLVLPLASCVTEGAKQQSRKQFSQPDNIKPNKMLVAPDYWRDTNANGYLDTINVTVYLFDTASSYPLGLALPGTFTFTLNKHNGPAVATWTFTQDQAAAAIRRAPGGATYLFELSILKAGASDVMPAAVLDLSAEFTGTDGVKVPSDGASSYRFEGISAPAAPQGGSTSSADQKH